MSTLKLLEHVLAYLFMFYTGFKTALFFIKDQLTTWDWFSIFIALGFTAYFIYIAQNRTDKQIL